MQLNHQKPLIKSTIKLSNWIINRSDEAWLRQHYQQKRNEPYKPSQKTLNVNYNTGSTHEPPKKIIKLRNMHGKNLPNFLGFWQLVEISPRFVLCTISRAFCLSITWTLYPTPACDCPGSTLARTPPAICHPVTRDSAKNRLPLRPHHRYSFGGVRVGVRKQPPLVPPFKSRSELERGSKTTHPSCHDYHSRRS